MNSTKAKRVASAVALVIFVPLIVWAQKQSTNNSAATGSAEARATKAFEVAQANPMALYAFLLQMPKGADLHNHLSGAVYAESWIRAAIEDHLCVDTRTFALSKPQSKVLDSNGEPECDEGKAPAANSVHNQSLYDSMIDAFSMRAFVPASGESGHDHFFAAFSKFDAVDKKHTGEWLDEVATRAADQNEQYLELMVTPPFPHVASIANNAEWNDDFAKVRADFLAQGIKEDVESAKQYLDEAEAIRRERERCGEANATAACSVQIRYLYQIL